MEDLINNFANNIAEQGQEGYELAQMFLEEEETFHLSTYDITGIYDNCKSFLCKNYSELLIDACITMCPYDTEELVKKIKNVYGECTTNRLALECLATIVLDECQHYQFWYTIWGTEENCLLDFSKYNINLALYDAEDFPIIQGVDIVAAMIGVNDMVQPSDLYNVFAYYADELSDNEEVTLIESVKEPIFTPDPFEVAGVVARYKNYTDFINSRAKKAITEYAFKFNELSMIENETVRETFITASIYDE